MSIANDISAGWSFGQDLLKYVIGAVAGGLVVFMSCGRQIQWQGFAAPGKDSVIERTFFIPAREPSARGSVATKPDTVRDTLWANCWDRIPPSAIGERDTLSIDSANSCIGEYRGIRITRREDTVRVRDTIRTGGPRFTLPALDSVFDFGYSISAGAGPAVGAYGIADVEARAWFRNFMIEVRPQVFVQDKLRAFISATLRYKIR